MNVCIHTYNMLHFASRTMDVPFGGWGTTPGAWTARRGILLLLLIIIIIIIIIIMIMIIIIIIIIVLLLIIT